MTSANVTEYSIWQGDKLINTHRQHHYCKSVKPELEQYNPPEHYQIEAMWLDEEEWDHHSNRISLKEYLEGRQLDWEQTEDEEE